MREKVLSGCGLSGILDKRGNKFSGRKIADSIALMHERSNGLGGGFAAYGIYPEYRDKYAFHLFYDDLQARKNTEDYLEQYFKIYGGEKIPTGKAANIKNPPLIWRYFCLPAAEITAKMTTDNPAISPDEYVVQHVMTINTEIKGSYVFSSGKNMGTFKGVGYAEDIAEFYKLDNYKGYLWTAHGRFPTNTPGWWGGAHPFTLLDRSVVHNGEISSYGANKRYVEMYGYKCTMMTDTEVITYLFDLITRRHKLPPDIAIHAVASPLWNEIERMDPVERRLARTIRAVYGSCLLNGPFSIIMAHSGGFIALNDRIKLRPLVAAEDKDKIYVASEESAIREICSTPDRVWSPRGGEAVIGKIKEREGAAGQDEFEYEKSRVLN